MGLGRSIFRHTVVYSAATVLGRLASFLMLPFYAHIFEAEGYGVIGMIDASLGIFTILLAGGFQTAILRIYHEQDESKKHIVLGTGIRLVWCIGGGLVLLPLAFSMPLSNFVLGTPQYYPLFCLALLTFVIDVAGQCASTIQIIRQQSILFSFIGLARLFVGLGLNIWLVVVLRVGLIGIFVSSFVSALLASAVFHYVASREHRLGFDKSLARELLRFQLPLLPGEIISFVGRQAERIMVRILIGLEGMGVLEVAYKFPPLLNLFINVPFQRAWRTKCFEIAEKNDAPRIISEMFTRYLFMMIFAGLLLAVTIRDILELMTPPEFWQAARITKIEIVTTILSGSTGYLTFGLIYHKLTKTMSFVKSTLTPVKVVLGIMMISTWGLEGAAYSALVIEVATLVWLVSKSQQHYSIPVEYGKIFVLLSTAGGLYWLLDGNSYTGFGPANFILEHVFSPLAGVLQDSPLGGWKSGKLVQLFREKQNLALSAILNSFFALAFLALAPMLRQKDSLKSNVL
ncbi:lipopolysaccharide biosynthesis protein [Geobacter anodireducens]|nr:lipopolysaccharide biosynthesis protein [Geobacter anodireducens]